MERLGDCREVVMRPGGGGLTKVFGGLRRLARVMVEYGEAVSSRNNSRGSFKSHPKVCKDSFRGDDSG